MATAQVEKMLPFTAGSESLYLTRQACLKAAEQSSDQGREAGTEEKLVSECTYGEVVGERNQPGNGSNVMVYTVKGDLKSIIIVK